VRDQARNNADFRPREARAEIGNSCMCEDVLQSPTVEHTPDVLVVGGGLAGLTAALHLAERGLAPLVLEADPRYPGGRMAGGDTVTLEHGGRTWSFRGEHGVHGVWSPYRNLQAMLARHGLRPAFVPSQEEDWIYKHGDVVHRAGLGSAIRHSWIPAPFHYLNLFLRPRFLGMLRPGDWLSLFLVWYGLVYALAIDPLAEDQPLAGHHLSDLMWGWSPAVRAFWTGLARNGLSAQPDEIPLSGFIAFLRFYTLRRRDSWGFSYFPADGGTSLCEPLAARLGALGGTLALGRRVTRLVVPRGEGETRGGDGGWRVEWDGGAACAPHVVLAVDAAAAAALLGASPDTAPQAAGLYWPRGRATAVARIWFDRAPDGGAESGMFNDAFVVDNFFWLHRIQEQYAAWHRATGGSAIEVHVYGPDEVLARPDTLLLAQMIADVQSAFPELRGRRIHQVLQRNAATHTLFGLGPRERHLGVATPWPGLACCGDWVRHPAPAFFLERACVTGIAAANAVLGARGLAPWPLLDYPPPEALAGALERLLRAGRRAMRRR
jgi:isorenieratene synthase